MTLLSCVNCCHNPLQSDVVGPSVGYCTQHRRLLLAPSQLTCGRHFRKDLLAADASREREAHMKQFSPSAVMRLTDKTRPANGDYTSASRADFATMTGDPVAVAAFDYGKLGSKIASLAQLRFLPGVRPELAMVSLARAYVSRCVENSGAWTSGIHLMWWTRQRLLHEPDVRFDDLRAETHVSLTRQVDLAKWSLIMMRLVLISDVGSYAGRGERVRKLASLAEQAAADTGDLSPKALLGWIKTRGERLFDAALSASRYDDIAARLHEEGDGGSA